MKNNFFPDQESLTKAYYESFHETVIYFQNKIFSKSSPLNPDRLEVSADDVVKISAVKNTFIRIHALALSLCRLKVPVDVTANAVLFRALFEQWIDMVYINGLESDDIEFKKYSNFTIVKRWLWSRSLRKYEAENTSENLEKLIPEELSKTFLSEQEKRVTENLESIWDRKLDENTNLKHWTAKSLYQRIQDSKFTSNQEKVQATFEYKEVYQWLNAFVHSGPEALANMGADALMALFTLLWPKIKEKYTYALKILVVNLGMDNLDPAIMNEIEYYENLHDTNAIKALMPNFKGP